MYKIEWFVFPMTTPPSHNPSNSGLSCLINYFGMCTHGLMRGGALCEYGLSLVPVMLILKCKNSSECFIS